MRAFIYVELTAQPAGSWLKPAVQWAKEHFTGATVFDIDSYSDEVLVRYAAKLLDEAERSVLYFRCEPDATLGAAAVLIEQVLSEPAKHLVVVQGEHPRLERLFFGRPGLRYFPTPDGEGHVQTKINSFLKNGPENPL